MDSLFYIKVKVGKFFANIVSGIIRNKERRHRLRHILDPLNPDRCVAYLEKHYTQVAALPVVQDKVIHTFIWVCWLQGLEQAPILVQNCIRSIERHKQKDQQIIIITANNYTDYINLPKKIVIKWEKGQITNTHFSDIIRIHALARYGGCWIDATCYMTAPIPIKILQSPLFLFRTHGEFSYTFIQSCFMVSEQNNYIMRKWCAAIRAYWENEHILINYFTLHLMFVALFHQDPTFKTEFEKVPIMSDEPTHKLIYEMIKGNSFSEALMTKAKASTFIQKLTYKFPSSLLENKNSIASYFSQPNIYL